MRITIMIKVMTTIRMGILRVSLDKDALEPIALEEL